MLFTVQKTVFTVHCSVHCSMFASRTTRTTPRNTRITSRTIRTIHIRSSPQGGAAYWGGSDGLEVVLVCLGVVLVVLEANIEQ